MSTNTDRLYNLLPAVYRVQDLTQGEPLHALLTLIEQRYNALDRDIAGLYENWFIETCAEWVVPYIGDLLGVRPLNAVSAGSYSARAYVAHTLDYRRKKGTAAMIEAMAADVTGWPAHVVEYFELLVTTQYMNHLRPSNIATVNLRHINALNLLDGPFESTAHTADVRHISTGGGRYNIPSLGIFLWKLEDYFIAQSDARAFTATPDGRYTFDPLGLGVPLCNLPQTKSANGRLSHEINVPGMLRRLPLYRELEALRQAEVEGAPAPVPVYFGPNPPFSLTVDGTPVSFDQIMICSIGDASPTDWRRPPASVSYTPANAGAPVSKPIALAADPVSGRIAFPAGITPTSVQVSYTYAFSGDIGAGPYDRSAWLSNATIGPGPFNNPNAWRVTVGQGVATIAAAIAEWNALAKPTDGVITIPDNHTHIEDLTAAPIALPGAARVLVLGGNGFRPHLHGSIAAQGSGSLFIDGLLIEGALTVTGSLAAVALSHSTLTKGIACADITPVAVNIHRAICGPVTIAQSQASIAITDSIVGDQTNAINAPNSTINVQTTTALGATECAIASASDSIFTGALVAQRHQTGCVRFSSLAQGSETARRYHCQPDLALQGVIGTAARAAAIAHVTPQFTSLDAAQPGFGQLSARCDPGISAGAENGAEMGAFNFLLQPQRGANLQTALGEYLRFGVEAGVIEQS